MRFLMMVRRLLLIDLMPTGDRVLRWRRRRSKRVRRIRLAPEYDSDYCALQPKEVYSNENIAKLLKLAYGSIGTCWAVDRISTAKREQEQGAGKPEPGAGAKLVKIGVELDST